MRLKQRTLKSVQKDKLFLKKEGTLGGPWDRGSPKISDSVGELGGGKTKDVNPDQEIKEAC